jgi:hypothetical protein
MVAADAGDNDVRQTWSDRLRSTDFVVEAHRKVLGNGDSADDAETAGSSPLVTTPRSTSPDFLGTALGSGYWLPERPFPLFKGSGERSHHRKALSGRFGVIRGMAVPTDL